MVLGGVPRDTVGMNDPGEPTPAGWAAPGGTLPAWNWIPAGHGLSPRLDRVPRWVKLWYRAPFVDRYCYARMWHHGGWDLSSDETGRTRGQRRRFGAEFSSTRRFPTS